MTHTQNVWTDFARARQLRLTLVDASLSYLVRVLTGR